ncbi:PREDICTED: keratin, type II cytoskeletal 1-like isoform X2 [Cyphomyrmex costatus]|uniref:keratin, type II cytoskeletal 1-like isoform X2 n=1 Tax=Cyphomyrmex costatus TaxID=456900 RepID=UPI0008522AD5|nr:PREDICTED: keratin, type II cytoskeletal 1-like isoform X2 [Cyphomyrmex costatus]
MQCILGTSNPDTMAVRALSLVLLFTFVTVIFGLPTTDSAVNTHKDHTLSTELLPPAPSSVEKDEKDEKERYATIYIVNLYAVKNISSNASEEMYQNEVVETLPDIIEPLVSVILVVEDDENEELENHRPVDLDEFADGLQDQGFKVDKIDLNSKTKVLKMKLEKAEAQSMVDAALKGDQKKFRQKRSYCLSCGGHTAVIPVVVVPISTGGYGHHHHHHHGHHGGYGGGCRRCGGGHGGGGGGGYSYAQAYASSGGYGYGGKK